MLIRFRRLFSTDKIIEKTREIMDNMLMDLNRNAERNVGLVNDSIKMLKDVQEETLQVQQEAERRVALLNGEIEAKNKSLEFGSRISGSAAPEYQSDLSGEKEEKSAPAKSRRSESKKALSARKSSEKPAGRTRSKSVSSGIDPLFQTNAVVDSPASELPDRGKTGNRSTSLASRYKEEQMQGNLFSSENSASTAEDAEAAPQNAEKGSRPSGEPEIIRAKNPVVVKKSINRQVQEYAALGMTEEEIASKLGRTVQEIKLMLEFS